MYIELFLLDNFVFDMLIIRIASAMSRKPVSHIAAIVVCAALSVYSAFAVNIPLLNALPFKILLLFAAYLPFYIKAKKLTFAPFISLFASTLITGGFVLLVNNGLLRNAPGSVRIIIYPALILSTFPTIIRRLRAKNSEEVQAQVRIVKAKKIYEFSGIFDSGSSLCEPLSGLPVIIVYAPELMRFADIPVRYNTAGKTGIITPAFRPDAVYLNGELCDALVAPTADNPKIPAIVPWTCREIIENALKTEVAK